MPGLSGTVMLDGSAVSGAPVAVVDTNNSNDPEQWTIVGGDVTGMSGDWLVSGLETDANRYHAFVQLDDGQFYNAESLPFLTADPGMFPAAVGMEVNAVAPEVGPAIPDSAIYRQNADSVGGVSDGEAVDPWPDLIGSMDLDAIGGPMLQTGSLNGEDAVLTDGTDDAFQYDTNLSGTVTEPATLLWAFSPESLPSSDLSNIWRDDTGDINEIAIRTDNDAYRLGIQTEAGEGGSPVSGDQIVTMAVDSSQAILRVNGSEVISIPSSSGVTILDGGNGGYFGGSVEQDRRYLHALWREAAVHNERLTGSDLTNEEQRLEDEANMSVL